MIFIMLYILGENQLRLCCEQLHEIEDLKKIVSTEPLKGKHRSQRMINVQSL